MLWYRLFGVNRGPFQYYVLWEKGGESVEILVFDNRRGGMDHDDKGRVPYTFVHREVHVREGTLKLLSI